MLLIVVFAVVAIGLIAAGFIGEHFDDWFDGLPLKVCGVILLIITLILGAVALHDTAYKDANTEVLRQRYNALIIQLDNGFYNKFVYDGRENLMDQIVKYNKTVTMGRAYHNSKWIGVFNQEDFDSLPLIDLDRINGGD